MSINTEITFGFFFLLTATAQSKTVRQTVRHSFINHCTNQCLCLFAACLSSQGKREINFPVCLQTLALICTLFTTTSPDSNTLFFFFFFFFFSGALPFSGPVTRAANVFCSVQFSVVHAGISQSLAHSIIDCSNVPHNMVLFMSRLYIPNIAVVALLCLHTSSHCLPFLFLLLFSFTCRLLIKWPNRQQQHTQRLCVCTLLNGQCRC